MKRKLSPDTRLDWRDDKMPVIRKRLVDGVYMEVDQEEYRKYNEYKIANFKYEYEWRDDPTYNLKKKKK